MATKVKHIQIDNMPTTWQPNAIYFVRSTGQIYQTDSLGIPVSYSYSQVMTYGGKFYMIAGKYMISNQDVGVLATSMSGISANSNIDAVNHYYAKGFFVASDGLRLKKMIGYVRIGLGVELPFIIGRKKFDGSGNLISTDILYEGNLPLFNGRTWFIDINSEVALTYNDMIVFVIDARSLSSNKSVTQLFNQLILK